MQMVFRITDSLKPEIKHKPDFLRGTDLRKIRKQIIISGFLRLHSWPGLISPSTLRPVKQFRFSFYAPMLIHSIEKHIVKICDLIQRFTRRMKVK